MRNIFGQSAVVILSRLLGVVPAEAVKDGVIGQVETSMGGVDLVRAEDRRAAESGAGVRDRLVKEGVSADGITVSSHGENNPPRPTADKVREPLKRRVDVLVK